MPKQQLEKRSREAKAEEPAATSVKDTQTKNEELKAEIDELLDEIDEVLEVNAEAFVKGYVQRGGQ